jgi:hypothetical protein
MLGIISPDTDNLPEGKQLLIPDNPHLPHRFSPLQRLDSTPHDRAQITFSFRQLQSLIERASSLAAAKSAFRPPYSPEEAAPDVSLLDELPPFLYTAAI